MSSTSASWAGRDAEQRLSVSIPLLDNSLPDHVVLSESVNTFKSRLDKFCQHQDMIYDFQAELHGTGSRSLHHN